MRTLACLLLAAFPVAALAACGGDSSSETAPSLTEEELKDPAQCQKCHPDHHQEWSGSMHAYASDDPVFRAMNARGQRETKGQLGTFCVKCHAPVAVAEGSTKDGTNLDSLPAWQKGVTCFFCHAAEGVKGTHDNPIQLATDGVMRASIKNPVHNTAHVAGYSPYLDRDQTQAASLCGSCHDIQNSLGAKIETTFQEWQSTVFSHAPVELTCGECHMDSKQGLAAQAPGVFLRKVHSHMFPAVDVALTDFPEKDAQKAAIQTILDSTIQAALCVEDAGGLSTIKLVLDNVGAGHDFPSGASQDRRLWAEIQVQAKGKVIYQSGVVAAGQSVIANADKDLWLLRECMFDKDKKPVDMFWQAASVSTDVLPGPVTISQQDPRFYQTHFIQQYPRDTEMQIVGSPDKVTAKLHLVPIGIDVLDDLVSSGDLAASVKSEMPEYSLSGAELTWTFTNATIAYSDEGLPETCVSVGLTTGAMSGTGVPALKSKCSP